MSHFISLAMDYSYSKQFQYQKNPEIRCRVLRSLTSNAIIIISSSSSTSSSSSSSSISSSSSSTSGVPGAKRASGAPWVSKSTHPRKFGNPVTVHRLQPVHPHHRYTNVYSDTFQLLWEPRKPLRKLSAHQCCYQLTAVKTRYPLTSITLPYRGLRRRLIQVEYFLKLSADKLLVFK